MQVCPIGLGQTVLPGRLFYPYSMSRSEKLEQALPKKEKKMKKDIRKIFPNVMV